MGWVTIPGAMMTRMASNHHLQEYIGPEVILPVFSRYPGNPLEVIVRVH
jgi:hypothetical protein